LSAKVDFTQPKKTSPDTLLAKLLLAEKIIKLLAPVAISCSQLTPRDETGEEKKPKKLKDKDKDKDKKKDKEKEKEKKRTLRRGTKPDGAPSVPRIAVEPAASATQGGTSQASETYAVPLATSPSDGLLVGPERVVRKSRSLINVSAIANGTAKAKLDLDINAHLAGDTSLELDKREHEDEHEDEHEHEHEHDDPEGRGSEELAVEERQMEAVPGPSTPRRESANRSPPVNVAARNRAASIIQRWYRYHKVKQHFKLVTLSIQKNPGGQLRLSRNRPSIVALNPGIETNVLKTSDLSDVSAMGNALRVSVSRFPSPFQK